MSKIKTFGNDIENSINNNSFKKINNMFFLIFY